ncbi:MAG: rod shape-determining protein RodA [candidate division KSB1 bacterium]|nr:rod shape-determining protein RodA [candidate division KSB1 bacterium]
MLARSIISWKDIDKVIIVCVLLLVTIGLMAIYSTTSSPASSEAIRHSFAKQVIWFLAGAMIASAVVLTPVQYLKGMAYSLYGLCVVLLILVLFAGGGKGVHRWFILGPVHFQPAEPTKIAALLALARYLSDERRDLRSFKDIGICFAMVLVPTVLILKEPDLGTAIVMASLLLPVLFWAGLSPFIVFLVVSPILTVISAFNVYTFGAAMLLIIGVLVLSKRKLPVLLAVLMLNVSVGALTPSLWNRLKDYQKTRILTFIGLQQDPRGTGYQVAQSQVAIGSGGFWGKGWTRGTQAKLRFLPEQHTDFIFSVVGEELGFFGGIFFFALYVFVLLRMLRAAQISRSVFGRLTAVGFAATLFFQAFVNLGMNVGIMPVTGIPLPFLSYGGTSLIVWFGLVGLLLNVHMRRF